MAAAFPVTDELNPGITANQPAPTESDLRHQLQLQSGGFGAAANGGGWTFSPGLGACEVLDGQCPRHRHQPAMGPGHAGHAQPVDIWRRTQRPAQISSTARNSVSPPRRRRRTASTSSCRRRVCLPSSPTKCSSMCGRSPASRLCRRASARRAPLLEPHVRPDEHAARQACRSSNSSQTSSISISPYVLHRFGDTGTAKIGYQLNQSSHITERQWVTAVLSNRQQHPARTHQRSRGAIRDR